MANLLVMMEFFRGALLPVSLETLGQARRLGSTLGMTVYALVPLPPQPTEDEDITVRCGRFGADKVMLLTGDSLFVEHEMRFEQYSDALVAACTMLPPRLFLMGDTPAARDIIPRLAARLGGAYVARGAALAQSQQLVLCDSSGRHLRIPLESASSDGIPPLTVPVMMTSEAGRYDMAWGDQDAELMIVPPNDESAQTIPNLSTSKLVKGGFVEETLEPLPLPLRVGSQGESLALSSPAPLPSGGAPPVCQISFGKAAGSDAILSPWRVSIGSAVEETANYQLILPEGELATAAKVLGGLLSASAPVTPIATPGPLPAVTKELEGFDDSNEFTPTAESWDYSADTLNGDEETTARIRAAMGADGRVPVTAAYAAPSVVTPPARPVAAVVIPARPVNTPPATGAGAAMWEGFATMPDEEDLPQDEDGNPIFDVARADTAPVPIAPPSGSASKKKEGA